MAVAGLRRTLRSAYRSIIGGEPCPDLFDAHDDELNMRFDKAPLALSNIAVSGTGSLLGRGSFLHDG